MRIPTLTQAIESLTRPHEDGPGGQRRIARAAAREYALPVDIPARIWLERFALLVPGPAATRWLLIADLVCLVALGLAVRARRIAVPVADGAGLLAQNVQAMLHTDFFLGLAPIHQVIGTH